LRWFASAARKRSYLWCFRVKNAVPALYAGCILALLPLYGIQLPIAVGLAFLFRANLPILTTTIFITNPVTILPAYFACFQIGRVLLHVFGMEAPQINMAEMKLLIEALQDGNWAINLHYLATVWWITSLGGIILGTSLATIASGIYKLAAYEVMVSFNRLKELQKKRQEQAATSPEPTINHTHTDSP
jgi:uncharacterized protein (DUF2062 family)